MRIAHVVVSLDVGGIGRVVLGLAREGRRLGQRVAVVCVERPGALAGEAGALGVPLRCVNRRTGPRLTTIRRLREVFSGLRPDVVHAHKMGALQCSGPAARLAGVPVVVHTEHGKHVQHWRGRWFSRLAALSADRLCCVSADIASALLAARVAPAGKVVVVPNGIDPADFADRGGRLEVRLEVRRLLDIPADAPVIGTVGRLALIKRQELLIRGFARLGSTGERPHLLLVGDGPRAAELAALARALGVDQRVHFAGYRPDPWRFLQAMDVFALTSHSEGMPLVVLEAWAGGLPVVASRVGGLPELVVDGKNGLLFDSGDEIALDDALRSVLADPALARRMGQAGRALVCTRFNASVMAEAYQRHYLELLARRRGPGAAIA